MEQTKLKERYPAMKSRHEIPPYSTRTEANTYTFESQASVHDKGGGAELQSFCFLSGMSRVPREKTRQSQLHRMMISTSSNL